MICLLFNNHLLRFDYRFCIKENGGTACFHICHLRKHTKDAKMMSKQDFKNFQVYLDCATDSTQQIFTAVFLPKAHIKGDFPRSSHFITSLID